MASRDAESSAAQPPAATAPDVHYAEDGWSWAWLAAAPLGCAGAGLFERITGAPVHWLMLTVCALATMICHAIIIAATRIHGLVRVTDTAYWQGAEELPMSSIAGVLPEPVPGTRLLGELHELPRKCTEVGLRLHSDALVRAYARDAESLRAALIALVGTAEIPAEMSGPDVESDTPSEGEGPGLDDDGGLR